MGVKSSYKKVMNSLATEGSVGQTDSEANDTKDTKTKKKNKKKKDRSQMSAEEVRVENKKDSLRKIYDCLMYQQCMI